jgi:hypothetical protein
MRTGSNPPTFSVTPSRFGQSSRRARRVAVITSAVAAVLVVAAITKWATRPSGPTSATGGAVPSSAAKPIAAPEPADRTKVTLTIDVTPPKATVSLDGTPLATNPFRVVVIKDSRAHKLVASAPGFTSEERTIAFDQDAAIDLVLKRATGHAATQPAPPANPANPAPGSDLKKAPRAKTSIDEEDPYQ